MQVFNDTSFTVYISIWTLEKGKSKEIKILSKKETFIEVPNKKVNNDLIVCSEIKHNNHFIELGTPIFLIYDNFNLMIRHYSDEIDFQM